jgi:zinc/manganese transport system substrate-binding protein
MLGRLLRRRLAPPALAAVLAAGFAGAAGAAAPLRVVAIESSWGSIAAQLGGDRVRVTSLISNPATDPHEYEPTAVDARALATAQLVVVNGIGYDPWAPRLLAANPVHGRIVLTVGDLLGVRPGANPHRWYSPPDVGRVVAAIAAAYEQLDPQDRAWFDRRRAAFEAKSLHSYRAEIAAIRRRYAGTKVGASESIFAMLAPALGLDLVTPSSFLSAVTEGADPTAADLATVERQLAGRRVKVWVYNSQNGTPDVQRLNDLARRHRIPVVAITETLDPPGATFQAWQLAQLRALAAALAG